MEKEKSRKGGDPLKAISSKVSKRPHKGDGQTQEEKRSLINMVFLDKAESSRLRELSCASCMSLCYTSVTRGYNATRRERQMEMGMAGEVHSLHLLSDRGGACGKYIGKFSRCVFLSLSNLCCHLETSSD